MKCSEGEDDEEKMEDGSDIDDGEFGGEEGAYEPSDEEMTELNTELISGLVKFCIEFRDHLTWKGAGFTDRTKLRLDRQKFDEIIQASTYSLSRSAVDFLQQVMEEIHFGKA
jgi:hypothetical protein